MNFLAIIIRSCLRTFLRGRFRVGDRVKILPGGGIPDFIGKAGVVVSRDEFDGLTRMYRVRLDAPVVSDDLWAGYLLKRLPRTSPVCLRCGCPIDPGAASLYCLSHVIEP